MGEVVKLRETLSKDEQREEMERWKAQFLEAFHQKWTDEKREFSGEVFQDWVETQGKPTTTTGLHAQATELLNFLNEKTGKNYRPVKANLDKIKARLKEYSLDELRAVVAIKTRDWKDDERMAPYLRPATLFGAEKCAQYMGEVG